MSSWASRWVPAKTLESQTNEQNCCTMMTGCPTEGLFHRSERSWWWLMPRHNSNKHFAGGRCLEWVCIHCVFDVNSCCGGRFLTWCNLKSGCVGVQVKCFIDTNGISNTTNHIIYSSYSVLILTNTTCTGICSSFLSQVGATSSHSRCENSS